MSDKGDQYIILNLMTLMISKIGACPLRPTHTKLKLQLTGFRLAFDSKIGVNGTMLYQCIPTLFYQSEASLKPVGS